jgi:glycine dehydrogenase subunit 1
MAALGPQGLRELGEICARRSAHLRERLTAIPGVEALFDGPVVKEFCVRLPRDAEEVVRECRARGVHPGFPLGREWPEYGDGLAIAVTERRSPADLDLLVSTLEEVLA